MTEPAPRVYRAADGSIALRLTGRERDVLRALLGDLELLVAAPSLPEEPWDADERLVSSAPAEPGLDDPLEPVDDGSEDDAEDEVDDLEVADIRARLYPSAAPENPGADASYRRLVHADLEDLRRRRIGVVVDTLGARELDYEQGEAWLATLNDLRLVLGTRLGVTEDADAEAFDPEDPDAAARVVYAWTGWLEGQFVDVLAAALPDAPDDVTPDDVTPDDTAPTDLDDDADASVREDDS